MEGNQNVDEWGSIDGSNGVNRKGNNSTKNGNATGKDVRSTISNNNNADSHQEESTAEDERKLSSDVLLNVDESSTSTSFFKRKSKPTHPRLARLNTSSSSNSSSTTNLLRQQNGYSPVQGNGVPSSPISATLEHGGPRSPGLYYGPSKRSSVDKYDPTNPDFAKESTGRRIAYENFTTIDWIHDFAKERVRLKAIKSIRGIRGRIIRAYDASQAWVLVFLIGSMTGFLAAMIVVTSEWLGDIKDGYCEAGYYLNRKFCCWHRSANEVCEEWIPWSMDDSPTVGNWWIQYVMYTLFAIVFAAASAVLVKVYAPYAAGSGIPEVKTILGGFVIRKFLGGWTLLIKCVGLVLSVASGLSLGKEGPLVHVACCVGNILPRVFEKYRRNEAKKRELLSAASAAGVSVAFGAPIGGVLFSLEEVSYYFPYKTMWRSFVCAMVAAICLQLINPFRTGKLVLFQVTYNRDWHAFELPFFIILGVLGGIYGTFFIRYNLKVASLRRSSWLRQLPIYEVLAVALVTSLISFPHKFLRVSTVELVANLFRECEEVDGGFHGLCDKGSLGITSALLLLAALIKILLTVFTFGIRVPAGIFIPSMAIGACVGRALGIWIQMWQTYYPDFFLFASCKPDVPCVTPGTYAMVGAAAALGGVTRMTVSLTVIMFELTGALTYVLPIMVTIMVSKWVGDAFGKESIYDGLVHLNGYPFLDPREEYSQSTTTQQVMTRAQELFVLPASGMTVDELEELLQTTDVKGFPVVNSVQDMMLIGYAGRAELRYALDEARRQPLINGSTPCYFNSDLLPLFDSTPFVDLRPWVDQTPITLSPKFPMDMVMEVFKKLGVRYVLITKDGVLQGLLTKKDLLLAIRGEHGLVDENGNLSNWISGM